MLRQNIGSVLGNVVLLSTVLILSACGSTPKRQMSCSCADYLPSAPRPAWTDRETAVNGEYVTQGIAECSGVKSLDFADADRRARDSLGRMINVQVKSEVISVIKDSGATGGASRSGQITSEHVSAVLLQNSQIFSHWIDPASCTIYAGAKISRSDIDRAVHEAQEAERRKYVNQSWSIQTTGQFAELVQAPLGELMSELGATVQNGGQGNGYVMSGELSDVTFLNDNRMARVTLKLEVHGANGVLWSRLIAGKGVTFNYESEAVLVKKAMQDVTANARVELSKFMQESVKQ